MVPEGKRERRTVAGRFDAAYINVDKCVVDGVKLYGVMHAYSAETAEIYESLFNPHSDELQKNVKDLLGGVTFRNILVINRVEILPEYRGMGLGLATMWNLIRRHSAGCGIVVLKAFPFQFRAGRSNDLEESDWNKKMGYDPYIHTMEFAHEKLLFHVMKLGFERIGDTGVLALSTSTQIPIPQEIHRWVP
jgi:GNAT superfamily N-acetyltransferase